MIIDESVINIGRKKEQLVIAHLTYYYSSHSSIVETPLDLDYQLVEHYRPAQKQQIHPLRHMPLLRSVDNGETMQMRSSAMEI